MSNRSDDESTIVVYAWPWFAALKAAKIFTDKDHHRIRINAEPHSRRVIVSALVENHALAIRVLAHWIDLSPDHVVRDRAFELEIKDIDDILQIFKTKQFAGVELEDQPLYAIHLGEHIVRFTNADQLDVTEITPLSLPRRVHDQLPDNIHDVVNPRLGFPIDKPARITGVQSDRLSKLAKILKVDVEMQALEIANENQLAKTAISCGDATSMATIPKPQETAEDTDQEPPSFADEEDPEDSAADYDEPLFPIDEEKIATTAEEETPIDEDTSEPIRTFRVVGAHPPTAT